MGNLHHTFSYYSIWCSPLRDVKLGGYIMEWQKHEIAISPKLWNIIPTWRHIMGHTIPIQLSGTYNYMMDKEVNILPVSITACYILLVFHLSILLRVASRKVMEWQQHEIAIHPEPCNRIPTWIQIMMGYLILPPLWVTDSQIMIE